MRNIKFQTLEVFLLVLIVLLGAFIYLYKLGSIPSGLYLDEAGSGYNAYSILKNRPKMSMAKSFSNGDASFWFLFTSAFIFYLSALIMAVFGLSVFSARLVSAICGIISIVVVFFVIKESKITKSKYTPLLATLFFAITPWAVFFSRTGYEQNLAFLFFSLSVLLIQRSLNKPKLLVYAIPVISLATYTDYAQKILAPLLLVGVFIVFKNILLKQKNLKHIAIGSLVAFIIQIPNLLMLFTPSFYTKTDHLYTDVVSSQAQKIAHFLPSMIAFPLAFLREFLSKFVTFFSPRSLFFLARL